jgi:hypothetical protein
VDGGKGGGSRDRGRDGGVVKEGGGEGSSKGGGQGSHEGRVRGVLIFDQLLISLHFSQTIILSILHVSQPHPLQ